MGTDQKWTHSPRAIVGVAGGIAYEKKKVGAAIRRQHPPMEVVRRLCGVTDGLSQERMAAATIPDRTTRPGGMFDSALLAHEMLLVSVASLIYSLRG